MLLAMSNHNIATNTTSTNITLQSRPQEISKANLHFTLRDPRLDKGRHETLSSFSMGSSNCDGTDRPHVRADTTFGLSISPNDHPSLPKTSEFSRTESDMLASSSNYLAHIRPNVSSKRPHIEASENHDEQLKSSHEQEQPTHPHFQLSLSEASTKVIKLSEKTECYSSTLPAPPISTATIPTTSNLTSTTRTDSHVKPQVILSIDNATILLPFFVVVEGYRVAAYSIDGEPRLCLPQLIQFLRQKFTVKNIVEKFEESNIKFSTSTSKQVQGFIRFKALLSDAKACPMIKLSDANRVCFKLYESRHKRRGDGQLFNVVGLPPSLPLSHDEWFEEERSNQGIDAKSLPLVYQDKKSNFEENKSTRRDSSLVTLEPSELRGGDNLYMGLGPRSVDPTSQAKLLTRSNPFNQTEIDADLTLMPETLSATLRIQVYHRCIGKCSGAYYPYLLKDGKAKCIQCKICRIFLSPRRFVGHTHKSTEDNIVHWGFNSYNWRCYIRLSKKQTDNNLEDTELLNQFRTLQFAPDFVDEVDDSDYTLDFSDAIVTDKGKSDQSSSSQSSSVSYNDWFQRANPQVIAPTHSLPPKLGSGVPLGDATSRYLVQQVTRCGYNPSIGHMPQMSRDRYLRQHNPSDMKINTPYMPGLDPFRDTPPEAPIAIFNLAKPPNFCRDYSLHCRSDVQTFDTGISKTAPSKDLRETFAPSSEAGVNRELFYPSLCSISDDKEYRREMYVSLKLADLLTRRGFNRLLINDLVENMLNLMRESRRLIL